MDPEMQSDQSDDEVETGLANDKTSTTPDEKRKDFMNRNR